jgi:thiol:disulfide interchange protein DsbC
MNKLLALVATLFLALLALSAGAQDAEAVKAALKKKFPEVPIESVRKITYGDLFEVVGSGELYYTDDKTSFLFVGSLIDTRTKENVTELRMRQVNAIKFETLPLESAIKIVRGNGSRKVAIFEDPNCGYCKRFERDLTGVNDLTMYVFLYPILSPDSVEKSRTVWCSADRSQAWLDLMLKDALPPPAGKCDTPIDRLLAFGRERRIMGTPTVIFEDGERLPGAMTVAQFEKRLGEAKAAIARGGASGATGAAVRK